MAYFLNLFTPETWEAFNKHGLQVSGFRERQRKLASDRVKPGDIFLCYLVKVSRWCGALAVQSNAFIQSTPIYSDPDPFVVRFNVRPIVALDPEHSLPMLDEELWSRLQVTKDIPFGVKGWGIPFRGSLRQLSTPDGDLILERLNKQEKQRKAFPFNERDLRQLDRKSTMRTTAGEVAVEIPDDEDDEELTAELPQSEIRQSILVQAKIARIGAEMGFSIWLPRNDRGRVKEHLSHAHHKSLLDDLPFTYERNFMQTIEQIDVIWLRKRSMARAFEVEHSTAIYSGMLRMADLHALQPNIDIRLHVVAPDEKRAKVMKELKRPIFSALDQGPLYEKCTYISYSSVDALSGIPHLAYMNDTIIEEYEEAAEEQ